jgi:plastocyanin
MYFSRATVLSALAGFATAQSAVEAMKASEMMMGSASTTAAAAMMGSDSAATASIALSTAVAAMPSAAAGMVNTHVVQVGGSNGSLTFLPNNVIAQAGDLVQFQFHPKVRLHDYTSIHRVILEEDTNME